MANSYITKTKNYKKKLWKLTFLPVALCRHVFPEKSLILSRSARVGCGRSSTRYLIKERFCVSASVCSGVWSFG